MVGLLSACGRCDAGLQLSAPAGTAPTAWAAQQRVPPRAVFPSAGSASVHPAGGASSGRLRAAPPCRAVVGGNKAAHGTLRTKILTREY
jgi:hypothetical protein